MTVVAAKAIVTAALPLKEPPDSPVPMVKEFGVTAVTVVLPPNATALPLMVIELLTNALLGIEVKVFVEPLIEVPTNVVRVDPNETFVDPIVMDELVNPEFGMVALI